MQVFDLDITISEVPSCLKAYVNTFLLCLVPGDFKGSLVIDGWDTVCLEKTCEVQVINSWNKLASCEHPLSDIKWPHIRGMSDRALKLPGQ